ncbi:hypothetical protein WJX72_010180 [[Myrmecia] bisecta]|uniref:Uncharacterized protein n=1 Tax=[Myrmecia] bisecta TaxID=41462 RepID=A0AAW1QAU0_9CHLO
MRGWPVSWSAAPQQGCQCCRYCYSMPNLAVLDIYLGRSKEDWLEVLKTCEHIANVTLRAGLAYIREDKDRDMQQDLEEAEILEQCQRPHTPERPDATGQP